MPLFTTILLKLQKYFRERKLKVALEFGLFHDHFFILYSMGKGGHSTVSRSFLHPIQYGKRRTLYCFTVISSPYTVWGREDALPFHDHFFTLYSMGKEGRSTVSQSFLHLIQYGERRTLYCFAIISSPYTVWWREDVVLFHDHFFTLYSMGKGGCSSLAFWLLTFFNKSKLYEFQLVFI